MSIQSPSINVPLRTSISCESSSTDSSSSSSSAASPAPVSSPSVDQQSWQLGRSAKQLLSNAAAELSKSSGTLQSGSKLLGQVWQKKSSEAAGPVGESSLNDVREYTTNVRSLAMP